METEIEITVECAGFVYSGKSAKYDAWFGAWIPGEHPDVEGFKVFIRKGRDKIEITDFLSDLEIEKLKHKMIDEYLDAV